MKALHVIPSLSLAHGGPSIAIQLMQKALLAAGVSVTVAATNDDGPGKRSSAPLNQPIPQDGADHWIFPKETEFYKVSRPLRAWLRAHAREFDVIHVHALFSFSSVMACRAARAARVPYIIRPLGVLNEYGMRRRRRGLKALSFRCIELPLIQGAAAMHYTAEAERRQAEALGIATRAAVIPLGIDPSPFAHLPSPELFLETLPQARGRPVILFLGRLDPKKGLDLLLPAFAKAREQAPGAALVLAGGGDPAYTAGLRSLVSALGLADCAHFTGFLTGARKLSALAAATVFVLPSYSENFGISVVEALAAGLPCIVSDQTAVSDEILEAGAGLVIPCGEKPLAEALSSLLNDHPLRTAFSLRARALVQSRYTLEIMGARLAGLYQEVARDPRSDR